jgi:hypothetical protein
VRATWSPSALPAGDDHRGWPTDADDASMYTRNADHLAGLEDLITIVAI